MAKADDNEIITLDEKSFPVADLSDFAKSQLDSIQFVETQLQQLNNELAVADTARIGYTNALKNELSKIAETK